MLISLICVCGLSAGVCFADETPNPAYYYVNSGKELTVYSSAQIGNNCAIMQIPNTYAFKYVKEENSTFVEIEYNDCKGYVLVSDLNVNCTQVNAKWGNNPFYYVFNADDFNTFTADNVTTYFYNNATWTADENSTPTSLITVTKVYGYYKDANQDVYFLVDFDVKISTGIKMEKHYIKASDFSTAQSNLSPIPESAGYKAQTASNNSSNGGINSGAPNPTTNPSDSDVKDSANSFERYILIAVIAVLCVVIIILIFAPAKKRQ